MTAAEPKRGNATYAARRKTASSAAGESSRVRRGRVSEPVPMETTKSGEVRSLANGGSRVQEDKKAKGQRDKENITPQPRARLPRPFHHAGRDSKDLIACNVAETTRDRRFKLYDARNPNVHRQRKMPQRCWQGASFWSANQDKCQEKPAGPWRATCLPEVVSRTMDSNAPVGRGRGSTDSNLAGNRGR
ncbi:hypothetical protein SKAU_G00290360 [Synaphobranchus kaupii]|uniref:Uncharacterized protein n=1 Tax=Synaphobranchus kaupii TaxID=118154 RepID=A0A9Q1ETP5_SYNKA|nr:hypothetical protein SKAU_G00290360 [Synaphobranchus kaupii]